MPARSRGGSCPTIPKTVKIQVSCSLPARNIPVGRAGAGLMRAIISVSVAGWDSQLLTDVDRVHDDAVFDGPAISEALEKGGRMGTAAHCVDDEVRRQLLLGVSAAVRYPNSGYASPGPHSTSIRRRQGRRESSRSQSPAGARGLGAPAAVGLACTVPVPWDRRLSFRTATPRGRCRTCTTWTARRRPKRARRRQPARRATREKTHPGSERPATEEHERAALRYALPGDRIVGQLVPLDHRDGSIEVGQHPGSKQPAHARPENDRALTQYRHGRSLLARRRSAHRAEPASER